MKQTNVKLVPIQSGDREQFILDNQRAFKFGATEEFGRRDEHFEEDGEIISRKTIENSMDAPNAETYRIVVNDVNVGGTVIVVNNETHHNHLDLLFIMPEAHSNGIGYGAWQAIERLHPETEVWETCTPYFETRNIHFYINKCGFHAVEFFNTHHPDPNEPEEDNSDSGTSMS